MKILYLALFLILGWPTLASGQTAVQGQGPTTITPYDQRRPEAYTATPPLDHFIIQTPPGNHPDETFTIQTPTITPPVNYPDETFTIQIPPENATPVISDAPSDAASLEVTPPLSSSDSQILGKTAQKTNNFEELLAEQDGQTFQYQGRSYVWQDGVPFEQNEDGSLVSISPPEDLFVVDNQGQKWLSKQADGTIYISVAPKVWAMINFANNSDIIEESSELVLDIFGNSLNTPALVQHRLIVVGHTSAKGKNKYNLKLSRLRAQSVSRYLIKKHGLNPDRLILHGYGEERPVADNDTEEGERLNRRVEFILLAPASED